MLEHLAALYPFFLVAGLSIAGTLAVLRRQTRARQRIALDLVRLNQELNFDTLAFLDAGARRLTAAGFRGVDWEVEWFGAVRPGNAGAATPGRGTVWERRLGAPDMTVRLRFLPGRLAGEHRFFAEFLSETFVLLLQTDLWIKAGGIASALSEFQRLTLFLGHDVKNLAQFIRILGDQIETLPPEEERAYLAYLRAALPLFRQRSERIVKGLVSDRPAAIGEPADVALAASLERLCAAHGLMPEIRGQGMVRVAPSSLDGILDNLLLNHAQHAPRCPLSIDIRPAGGEVTAVIAGGRVEDANLLHLFEPFWTNSSSGLGLGLHQARQLARESGGSLGAGVGPDGRLQFELRLPASGQ
ncbi:MAG TPA: HAMP domain-containing sensor histidine kinase [Rhodocyclaceae bacterium]|nr:HAMP domain-containing sensor histidine kinase [Rhodocyclaceae bacterium]